MLTSLATAGDHWQDLKIAVAIALRVSSDALHILIGFAVYLGLAVIFRVPLNRLAPLLGVAALLVLNEVNDLRAMEITPRGVGDALRDVVLTMVLPVLVFLIARHRPSLIAGQSM